MEFSSEELGSGSRFIEVGHSYHFECTACEEKPLTMKVRKNGQETGETYQSAKWVVSAMAHAGTIEGQDGKQVLYSDMFLEDICELAIAVGLQDTVSGQVFTRAFLNEVHKAKKEGRHINFGLNASDVVGRQFYANVVLGKEETGGKYAGQKLPKFGNKIVSPLDPSIADDKKFPKCPVLLAQLTGAIEQLSTSREPVGAGASGAGVSNGNGASKTSSRPALD